jgi:hypothetical protein
VLAITLRYTDTSGKQTIEDWGTRMAIILLALLVLILFGAGFAIHLLWIAAVVLAIVWVATYALGRGRGASRGTLRR